MTADDLKEARATVGLTQVEAAGMSRMTPDMYSRLERGRREIDEETESRLATLMRLARDLSRGSSKPYADEETVLALGEAVLLLGAEAREELLANVRRETVLKAVAEVTLARCRGSVVEAIGERDARIRQLEGR